MKAATEKQQFAEEGTMENEVEEEEEEEEAPFMGAALDDVDYEVQNARKMSADSIPHAADRRKLIAVHGETWAEGDTFSRGCALQRLCVRPP